MKFYALHGFLGLPSDWSMLLENNSFFQGRSKAVDLFDYPVDSLKNWAEQFNAHVRKTSKALPRCLIGYSLGGRLALHCLVQDPLLWQAAIIVSAHYGLSSEKEKKERLYQDQLWENSFTFEKWGLLMKAWDNQKVFKNRPSLLPRRFEGDYSRSRLCDVLTNLSLGQQDCLRDAIATLELPILWVTGEQDEKFSQLAKEVHLKDPLSRIGAIPGAGHRVPWEKPGQFLDECQVFLQSVTGEAACCTAALNRQSGKQSKNMKILNLKSAVRELPRLRLIVRK